MNAAGNVLWNKTINNAAPGNFESCSDILFDESNGDVYAFGTTADNIFISRYQSTTGSSGYIKLDDIKGEKVRGIIRELRRQGEPICSVNNMTKSGYYYCLTDAIKTINNLESRSFSMLKTAKAMREKCGLLNEPKLIQPTNIN